MERHCTTTFLTVAALVLLLMPIQVYACTVGSAHGSVTVDGRPMMWKMRDTSNARQQLIHSAGSPYDYIGVRSEGGSVFMGLNEAGIGSGNATVTFCPGVKSFRWGNAGPIMKCSMIWPIA